MQQHTTTAISKPVQVDLRPPFVALLTKCIEILHFWIKCKNIVSFMHSRRKKIAQFVLETQKYGSCAAQEDDSCLNLNVAIGCAIVHCFALFGTTTVPNFCHAYPVSCRLFGTLDTLFILMHTIAIVWMPRYLLCVL